MRRNGGGLLVPVWLPGLLGALLAGLAVVTAGAVQEIRTARAEAARVLVLLESPGWPATDSEVEAADALRAIAEGGSR